MIQSAERQQPMTETGQVEPEALGINNPFLNTVPSAESAYQYALAITRPEMPGWLVFVDVLLKEGATSCSRASDETHQVVWPGWMEVVSEKSHDLLDSHNPDVVVPLTASSGNSSVKKNHLLLLDPTKA